MTEETKPKRERKNVILWQAYLWWDEVERMKRKHEQRIDAIERGESQMDAGFEEMILDTMQLEAMAKAAAKQLAMAGDTIGPIWEWVTSIKGLGSGFLPAQILAQIDYPDFATVSKLWRFCGLAVIDGKAEFGTRHFNRILKAKLLGDKGVADQFILHQTPVYVDIYYAEKARLRRLYPEPVPTNGSSPWPFKFTDSHINRMAKRKMVKVWLCHLWLIWRGLEGLPVTGPYPQDILGHTNIVEPTVQRNP
jgi:hypothetical protein